MHARQVRFLDEMPAWIDAELHSADAAAAADAPAARLHLLHGRMHACTHLI